MQVHGRGVTPSQATEPLGPTHSVAAWVASTKVVYEPDLMVDAGVS